MNPIGIETFLKATQEGPKSKPPASSASPGEFNDYLREAASAPQKPARQAPPAKAQPDEAPIQAKNHEQGSAESSGDEPAAISESAEQVDTVVEEQPMEQEGDEVLLSVAALAASSPEIAPVTDAPVGELAIQQGAAPTEPSPTQATQQEAPAQDFLPDLQQAISNANAASAEGDGPVSAEITDPAQATVIDESVPPVQQPVEVAEATPASVIQQIVSQHANHQTVVVHADKNIPIAQPPEDGQVAIIPQREQSQVNSAELPADNSDEADTTDHKSAQPAVVDNQAVTEKLATQVATAAVESTTTHEIEPKVSADTGSTVAEVQAEPQPQQQSQTRDSGRIDAQAVPSDSDSRLPTIDRTRFVQRVANAFRSAQQNDGHVQMRLSPPELGSLRIEIAVRNGVLTANLETETADARRVLLDNLPALRQRLAEQDIRIEKFDVDVRREGSQSDSQGEARDHQSQQQSQRAGAQNRIRTSNVTEVITTRVPRPHTASADAGLDVRI